MHMRTLTVWTTRWALSACLPLIAGCPVPAEDDTVPDVVDARPFATTKELDDAALAALTAMDPDGTLHFSGTPAQLNGIAYKSVLLAGPSATTGGGFIRMVTSVESTPDGLVARTVPAPIQFAFQKLDVQFTRTIPDLAQPGQTARRKLGAARSLARPFSGAAALPWAERVPLVKPLQRAAALWTKKPLDFFVFNGDEDPATEDDQVHVTGHLSGGVDYTFGINVDWGEVFDIPEELAECAKSLFTSCTVEDLMPEAKVGFALLGGVNAQLNMKGVSLLPYSKTIPIHSQTYDPIKIGPLWFFPVLEVNAEIEGAASSQFELSSTIDLSAGAELSYSNKSGPTWIPPHVDGFDIQAPAVDVALDAYSKIRLGPRLALKLYQIAGPYAGIYGFARLDADRLAEPCWTLTGGIEGELGFLIEADIPLFGKVTVAKYNEPLAIWSTTAASGGCTGVVTDALTAFQQPSFTPWSRAYAGTVAITGLPFTGPGGGAVCTDLQPSIDGRHVIAGSGATNLVKIGSEGEPTWARRFIGPTLGDPFISELLPDRVAPTLDAGMFVSAYPWALLKVSASGKLEWAKQVAFAPNRQWWRTTDVEADGAGGVYFSASYGTNAVEPLEVDALVGRLDADAHAIWVSRIGSPARGEVPRVIVPYAGGIVVAGSRWNIEQPGHWRLWAIRLDANGGVIWAREYPVTNCETTSEQSTHPHAGHEAPDGDLILGGTIDGAPERGFFAKLKPDGTMAFLTAYKAVHALNLEDLALTGLAPLPTSGYLAAGTYLPYPYSLERDIWIGALDGVGQFQWVRRLMSPDFSGELLPAVQYTPDGGLLAAGYTETLAGGDLGFWAIKAFAKDGQIAFAPQSGLAVTSLNLLKEQFCATTAEWAPPVQAFALEFAPIDVQVEDASAAPTQLGP